jgi:hypothetical protein
VVGLSPEQIVICLSYSWAWQWVWSCFAQSMWETHSCTYCLISSIHRTTLQCACQVGVLSTPVPWAFPKCEVGVWQFFFFFPILQLA